MHNVFFVVQAMRLKICDYFLKISVRKYAGGPDVRAHAARARAAVRAGVSRRLAARVTATAGGAAAVAGAVVCAVACCPLRRSPPQYIVLLDAALDAQLAVRAGYRDRAEAHIARPRAHDHRGASRL